MDGVRRVLGALLVIGVPPAVLFWFVIHPLAPFWRRAGPWAAYLTATAVSVAFVVALALAWQGILGRDLGTSWLVFSGGVALYGASAWLSFLTRKHLKLSVFVGLPEVSRRRAPGLLLQDGIYGVIRHPRYASVLLGTFGFAMVVNHVGGYAVVLAADLVLLVLIPLEEQELIGRFGAAYMDYRRRVPALIPRKRARRRRSRSGTDREGEP